MQKIIFTDIDGVLFPLTSRTGIWDPRCVYQYNRIIKETGAVCIVTSTRRETSNTVRKFQDLFNAEGAEVTVAGMTEVLGDRDAEIADWLSKNECTSYVIIDDFNLRNKTNFIRCLSYDGLTEELANAAISILNGQ